MTDEARLQRWIASRGGGAGPSPSDHIDMDTLTSHARGELPAVQARWVDEHLYVCEDGRCPDFVRGVGGENEGGAASAGAARDRDAAHDRTFQSREIIWNTFESMAREFDVSIDELVNEAMSAYARVRGYPVGQDARAEDARAQPRASSKTSPQPRRRDPLEETQDAGVMISALDRSYAPARAPDDPVSDEDDLARTSARGVFVRPGAEARGGRAPQLPSLPAPIDPLEPGEETRTAPRMNSPMPKGRVPSPVPPRQTIEPYAAKPPPLPPRSFPPTTIPMPGAPPRSQERRLMLTYQGRPYGVDKDRYLIGRSKTQADLRLDDPNVSRQHAVIEKVGAAYYLVDLGSTNGVHIAGERVARRAIVDGDVITITSHEIRVSLR